MTLPECLVPFTLTFCRPQRENLVLGSQTLDTQRDLVLPQAGVPGSPSTQEVPEPHEGRDLVSEQVLTLPQLGGDGDVEVSGEFMVTEGFLASRLEKDILWGPGWPGDHGPGASVWGSHFYFGDD